MCACSSVGAPPHDTCKYYRSLLEVTELDLSSPFKPCSPLLINHTVHCAERIVSVHGFCVNGKGGTGGDGWGHPQGDMHVVAVVVGFRNGLVGPILALVSPTLTM